MYPIICDKADDNDNLQDLGHTAFLKIHFFIVLTFHCLPSGDVSQAFYYYKIY